MCWWDSRAVGHALDKFEATVAVKKREAQTGLLDNFALTEIKYNQTQDF